MILILSGEDDTHVPRVTRKLEALGAGYLWFDPAHFPAESELRVTYERSGLIRQVLRHRERELDLSTVTGVWDRRPGVPIPSPDIEGEVQRRWIIQESAYCLAGVWENMECPWIPGKPRAIIAAQNKVKLLAVAARLGFLIPRTLITNSPEGLLDFYSAGSGRLITKVLRDGLVYRQSERYVAFTHPVSRRDLVRYRALRYAPLIIQEYVAKHVELRINVVGSRVFAAEIHSQASRRTRHDWRHYDNDRATYAPHDLPVAIGTLCVRLVRSLGLLFGAIDMVLTPDGEYVFLEINPTGQWGWVEHLTGLPIGAAIAELLVEGRTATAEGTADGSEA